MDKSVGNKEKAISFKSLAIKGKQEIAHCCKSKWSRDSSMFKYEGVGGVSVEMTWFAKGQSGLEEPRNKPSEKQFI